MLRRGVLLAVALVVGLPAAGRAVMDASTECLFEFGGLADGVADGGVIECTDCDPSCDFDGIASANGVCVFPLSACANVPRAGCRTAPLRSVKVRPRHARLPSPDSGEMCGLLVGVRVRARGDGARPGRLVLLGQTTTEETPRRTDRDRLTLLCHARPPGSACPVVTTTTLFPPSSTTSSSTSTTVPTTSTLPATTTTVPATTTTAPTATTTSTVTTTSTAASTTSTTSAGTTSTTGAATTTTTVATTTTLPATTTTSTTTTLPETTTTTSITVTTTTSTTTTTVGGTCEAIVAGQPIASTYSMHAVLGGKSCHTNSTANKFQPCTTDTDCGGTTGTCQQTPWITADGITLPFPTGVNTTFTVAQPDTFPRCEHALCISCGNPAAACAGIPGCVGDPSCTKTTCCDQPHFTSPAFAIVSLGTCVRIDQVACGTGVANTSNPQTGDNEVNKQGDTSDPGPDCTYGTADDQPSPGKPCNTAVGGQGADTKGKILRTLGNGTADAPGVHFRFLAPLMATAWSGDAQGCPSNAVFDGINSGELVLTQLILNAELSTAGASAAFTDLNGDGCKRAGAGFSGDGPVTLAAPTAAPMPYGGGQSTAVAAGLALAGGAPLFDTGFVAVVPYSAPTTTAPETCSCTVVPGCPE